MAFGVIALVCCAGPVGFFGFLAGGIWLPLLGFVVGTKTAASAEAA